jgi:hypothetical protein
MPQTTYIATSESRLTTHEGASIIDWLSLGMNVELMITMKMIMDIHHRLPNLTHVYKPERSKRTSGTTKDKLIDETDGVELLGTSMRDESACPHIPEP